MGSITELVKANVNMSSVWLYPQKHLKGFCNSSVFLKGILWNDYTNGTEVRIEN